jgi:microsomal dipeptidase-like Zn-dependent dipeptidase
MEEGRVDAVFMAAYLKQRSENEPYREEALSLISQIHQQVDMNRDRAGIATCTNDILQLKKESRKAILLGIENGAAIENDIDNLDMFRKLGVSYITLCHNGNNRICDSASDTPKYHGLSAFGEKVIERMNQSGIMIDISHASEKTAFDVLAKSKCPVIASHSSVKALCDHYRNLSDELILKMASQGGVVQICLYKHFIAQNTHPNVLDAIRHIDYICRLAGPEYVGIGSDFDGDGGITGVDSINELIRITVELLRRRYTPADIEKIWGGNLMRVMDANQNYFFNFNLFQEKH